jgi:hypothetical protein
LTVLHVIVDSLSDTPSGTGDAACTTARNEHITESIAAASTATAKRTRVSEGA